MKNNKNQITLLLLVIFFLLDQCIIGFQLGHQWRFATKIVLVPILMIYYKINTAVPNRLFIVSLIMSFLGDLFLMISGGFIVGLSSFLIAHIVYIFTFKPLFHKKNIVVIPFILIFIIGLITFLYPHLGVMKIPVFLYAITIGTMLYAALGTNQKWLIIGAILFVASDSILATNIFYKQSTIAGLSVMLTYVAAQFCLVQGMIHIAKHENSTFNL